MHRGFRFDRGGRAERPRHHPSGDPDRASGRHAVRADFLVTTRQTPQALMLLCRLTFCVAFAIAAPVTVQAGDFGRPKPSLLDGLIPQQFWKGPVTGYSGAPLTDLEVELRDRSYVLIRP